MYKYIVLTLDSYSKVSWTPRQLLHYHLTFHIPTQVTNTITLGGLGFQHSPP
jgi:hypothetical protein